jgi:hypothetical protein
MKPRRKHKQSDNKRLSLEEVLQRFTHCAVDGTACDGRCAHLHRVQDGKACSQLMERRFAKPKRKKRRFQKKGNFKKEDK